MKASTYRYDAFISYSHRSDTPVAVAVQNALHQLARPLLSRRALSVFRDKTSLTSSPSLWPSIEASLGAAKYFVLIASPGSSSSPWVQKEIAWWMANRSAKSFLIVLTEGELVWSGEPRRFAGSHSPALSPECAAFFPAEPLYIDLRWARSADDLSLRNSKFREAVLPLAAELHGLQPQDLDGEDLRQFRRTRLFWRSAVAGLAVLTVTSAIAAVMAIQNRNEAIEQAQTALSQKLAVDSAHQSDEDRDRALLLAREAYLLRPTSEARLSLLRALLRGRQLRFDRRSGNVGVSQSSCLDPSLKDGSETATPAGVAAVFQAGEKIGCVAHGPNGLVAVAANDSAASAFRFPAKLVIWDPAKNGPLWRPLTVHRERITAMAFSPDGKSLVSGDLRGAMYLWRLTAGEPESEPLDGHKAEIRRIQFDASGGTFVSTSADGDSIHWDRSNLQPIARPLDDQRATRIQDFGFARVAYAQGGRTLVATLAPDRVVAWDVAHEGPAAEDLMTMAGPHRGLAADTNGSRVAVAAPLEIQTIDLQTRRKQRIEAVTGPWYSVAFAPGGALLAAGTQTGTLSLWNVSGDQAKQIWSSQIGRSQIYDVAFDASGGLLLSTAGDHISVWTVRDGTVALNPKEYPAGGRVVRLALSADGLLLAGATWTGQIVIWRLASNDIVGRSLDAHRGSTVEGLEFSPDGRLLASSDANGMAMLWDVSQHEPIARLAVGGPTTSGLAFSPDGRRLAAGSDNRVVTVWDLEVDTWLRLACSITQRDLTSDEWTRYLLNRPYEPSCRVSRTVPR